MNCYAATIGDFLKTDESKILEILIEENPEADKSQIHSWKVLIQDLKTSSGFLKLPKKAIVSIEYQLPIFGMAVDVIVAGHNSKNEKVAYLIESKQWDDSFIGSASFSEYREEGRELHPQVQVYRHFLAFRDYLDIGANFRAKAMVFIRNSSLFGISILTKKNPNPALRSIKCARYISELTDSMDLTDVDSTDVLANLERASYKPSKDIIKAMNSMVTKLEPFILTSEQEEATKKIFDAVKHGKRIIRISGPAGSGKTAILLNLYVDYLNKIGETNITPIFISGAQNTALYRSLYPEVQMSFVYSNQLAKRINISNGPNHIVFFDEAQHNSEGIISGVVNCNAIVVIAYDENQTINANNSLAELKSFEERDDYVQINLDCCVRYNGSEVFEKNINTFLDGGTSFLKDDKYDFRVFTDLQELKKATLNLIKEKPECTVAVTGLLSNDAQEIADKSDNFFFIDWDNKYETKWIPYVHERHYLSKFEGKLWAGTWWLPGLDLDYNVVIVGGDAKMTEDGIVGVPELSKHYLLMVSIAEKMGIPRSSFNGFGNSQRISKLLPLLNLPYNAELKKEFLKQLSKYMRNIYYVMLTRGRKGCFVYFENNEKKY